MTFATKIKLQAGFPASFMFAFSLLILGIPTFLAYKSSQAVLDWVWTGLIFVFALVVLLRIFREQARQRLYSLHLMADGALILLKSCSGSDQSFKVVDSKFTRQTGKTIFATLDLANNRKQYLVFHQLRNRAESFRRFKVQLKWPQTPNK